jgi:hypothetical protein
MRVGSDLLKSMSRAQQIGSFDVFSFGACFAATDLILVLGIRWRHLSDCRLFVVRVLGVYRRFLEFLRPTKCNNQQRDLSLWLLDGLPI